MKIKNWLLVVVLVISVDLISCSTDSKPMDNNSQQYHPTNSVFLGDSLVDSQDISQVSVVQPDNYLPPIKGNNYWIPYYYNNYYLSPNQGHYNSRFHGAPITSLTTALVPHHQKDSANRPTWVNYLLAKTQPNNKRLYNYRYITTLKASIDFSHANIDMAYASAETGDRYISDFNASQDYSPYVNCQSPGVVDTSSLSYSCVPGVVKQIDLYRQLINNDKINPTHSRPTANTRYYIWAGANDFSNNLAKFILLATTADHKYINTDKLQSLIHHYRDMQSRCQGGYLTIGRYSFSCAVDNTREAVSKLETSPDIQAKPNQIYVLDLPDLSEVPKLQALAWYIAMHATTHMGPVKSLVAKKVIYKKLLGLISDLCLFHNRNLIAKLTQADDHPSTTRATFVPLANNHIYPSSKGINYIINHLSQFHFGDYRNHRTNSLASCVGNELLTVDPKAWLAKPRSEPAPNLCYHYVFYNSVHPSSHAHRCIALGLNAFINSNGKDFIAHNC